MATSVLSALPDRIQRPDVPVMEQSTADELTHIQQLWPRFEQLVGLRGRKMFARVDERAGTYTVCTPVKTNDRPEQLGLTLGILAGGWYLRGRLVGEPDEIYPRIGSGMTELKAITVADDTRPLVEFYRRRNWVELWVPTPSDAMRHGPALREQHDGSLRTVSPRPSGVRR